MRHKIGIAAGMLALGLCLLPAADRIREQKYQQAVDLFESKGDMKGAVKLFEEAAKSPDRGLAARALLYVGTCDEKLGQDGARNAYERLVREFADQPEVTAKAKARLGALGSGHDGEGVAKRLWGGNQYRQYTSISSDGRYATFVDWSNTIHIHDLATNDIRQVVKLPSGGWIDWPLYLSPDGKQLAYGAAWPGSGFSIEFHVIGSDGSNDRLLARGKGMNAVPQAWSPDGKHVIARFRHEAKDQDTVQTVLVSVSDGSFRVISPGFLQSSQFSPDGRYVVYESALNSNRSEVFLLSVDGGSPVPLVENAGIARSYPKWAPDGKRVPFIDDHRGGRDLWSIRVADGKPEGSPELVKENLGLVETGAIPIGISRNGDYFYNSSVRTSDLYLADLDPQRKAGSGAANIGRYYNSAPVWSPNGEQLAYLSLRSPVRNGDGYSLVIRSTETGEERIVFPKIPLDLTLPGPQWFPDGRSVLLHSSSWMGPSYTNNYYRVDIQTGEVRPVSESAPMPYNPTLAPDGRSIYYTSRNEEAKQTRILQRGFDPGEEKELGTIKAAVYQLSVSPDGRRFAFVADSRKLMILPTAGGEPKQVYEASNGGVGSPVWSKDGRRLLFAVGGTEIWSLPSEGGDAQPLGVGPLHNLWSFDLHPDGKRLVFVLTQQKSEFWVLKNLFGDARGSR